MGEFAGSGDHTLGDKPIGGGQAFLLVQQVEEAAARHELGHDGQIGQVDTRAQELNDIGMLEPGHQ